MFELIFVATILGKNIDRTQDFSSMGQCQTVLKSLKDELRWVHNKKILVATCRVKHKK